MESKKLEALLMAVDLGSFTKAAEVMGYTQSGAARARARRRPTDKGRRARGARHPRIFAGQRAA